MRVEGRGSGECVELLLDTCGGGWVSNIDG